MEQPPFVKKFDFRGVYKKDLKDEDAYYLGLAIQKILPLKKILVGWDTRVSSAALAMNFISAFEGKGIKVSFLEKCPIDYVTTAAAAFDFDYSVMFTGSHNPWNWSGLLMHTKGGASVQGEIVPEIVASYYTALEMPYKKPSIDLLEYEDFQPIIEETYSKKIAELIPLDEIKPMRVLVDVGDGSGSQSLSLIARSLPQVTFLRINDRELYDEQTPHTADPSQIENMQQLIDSVKKDSFDCGFAFDSDADRVLAIDEKGNYLNGSQIGSALVESFLSLNRGLSKVGYAVECGPALYNAVTQLGKNNAVTPVPVPVGRSLLRETVRLHEVDLAVENVGHFYIKDFFGTDSGAFSMLVLLYWMSKFGPLSHILQAYPDGRRQNFSLPIADQQEEKLVQLAENLNHGLPQSKKKITVDGIRYEFYSAEKLVSWYAFRPSGYEKVEKYYFGSLDTKEFSYLASKLKKE